MTESQKELLTDLSKSSRGVLPSDDQRHSAPAADPYWGETSWWVFIDPTADLAGWFYLLTRPNLGVASLGVWVWDGKSTEPWRLPYSKSMVHLQLPGDYDLADLSLDGHDFRLRAVEPLTSYEISYDDPGLFAASLHFEATVPPQPMGINDLAGHIDQALWVTGDIRLGDSTVKIDGPGFRDRTWSSRPEVAPGRANYYSWATTRADSFQLLGMHDSAGSPTHVGGYLFRDGKAASLVSSQRRVTDRASDGRPLSVEVDVSDSLGRSLIAKGECTATAALPGFAGYLTFASAVRWEIEGETVWGEDHDSWPHHQFRANFN